MELSAFYQGQNHHTIVNIALIIFQVCVSDYSASGKVLCQPPAGSLAHFSSHFARVQAFSLTLVEFKLFLTPCSIRAFGLSLPLTGRPCWLLVLVSAATLVKMFLLVAMLVMTAKHAKCKMSSLVQKVLPYLP